MIATSLNVDGTEIKSHGMSHRKQTLSQFIAHHLRRRQSFVMIAPSASLATNLMWHVLLGWRGKEASQDRIHSTFFDQPPRSKEGLTQGQGTFRDGGEVGTQSCQLWIDHGVTKSEQAHQ